MSKQRITALAKAAGLIDPLKTACPRRRLEEYQYEMRASSARARNPGTTMPIWFIDETLGHRPLDTSALES